MSETKTNDGGQIAWFQPAIQRELADGMTLRDYFAAAALNQRKMLSTGAWYAADAAREAYEIADAMLDERGKL